MKETKKLLSRLLLISAVIILILGVISYGRLSLHARRQRKAAEAAGQQA